MNALECDHRVGRDGKRVSPPGDCPLLRLSKLVRASTAMVATMVLFPWNTHADHAHCQSSALRGVRAAFMNMAYRFMHIFGLLAKQCSR